jgi:hypothetical protein
MALLEFFEVGMTPLIYILYCDKLSNSWLRIAFSIQATLLLFHRLNCIVTRLAQIWNIVDVNLCDNCLPPVGL